MKIIFFDTETTGNTPDDFICQLAYKIETNNGQSEEFCRLYKPPILIPPEASAITHITNKQVADKTSFKDNLDYIRIKTMFEDSTTIVVAHNVKFDLGMLAKEDIFPKQFICTLRLARYLDPESKLSQYKLQYLRYLLDLDIQADAHDALGDVLVLEALYARLKIKMLEKNNGDEQKAITEMLEVSSKPSLMTKFGFGKYKDQKVVDVASDKGYFQWLLTEKKKNNPDDEDWIYTLEYYLK